MAQNDTTISTQAIAFKRGFMVGYYLERGFTIEESFDMQDTFPSEDMSNKLDKIVARRVSFGTEDI